MQTLLYQRAQRSLGCIPLVRPAPFGAPRGFLAGPASPNDVQGLYIRALYLVGGPIFKEQGLVARMLQQIGVNRSSCKPGIDLRLYLSACKNNHRVCAWR